ncbi:hypothetical protein, partial [Streptomyces sp. SID337]|uniref:hypothetical protein n=2 Tax=Streptomyces TaxID=1883 RepID=UPI001F201538
IYDPAPRRAWDDRTRDAAGDLRALCETIARASLESLSHTFLTHTVPSEPDTARVLGCLLQLGHVPDAARFWWQFAAGAGDHPAAYCLALQHRSLGEEAAAAHWMRQIPDLTDPEEPARTPPGKLDVIGQPATLPTTLRILNRLKPDRRLRIRQPLIAAVMDYVVSTFKFVDDDVELPVAGPEFHSRIRALTAPGALLPARPPGVSPLPARNSGGTAIRSAQRRSAPRRIVLDLRLVCVPS